MHNVDWLLTGAPRPVQLEALRRSYLGVAVHDSLDDQPNPRKLPHYPRPAVGWAHFMEMRLGKTATALNEFMLFKRDFGVCRALIVCPNPIKGAWANDARQFGVDVPVQVYDQKSRKKLGPFLENNEGVLIVNYEVFVQSSAVEFISKWCSDRPCYVAADESVKIKNPKAIAFKNMVSATKEAHVFRALTGLPTPQAVTDMWSQLKFVRKLDGMNFFQFRARFAKMGGFKGKVVTGIKNPEMLGDVMFKSSFVAKRRDWGKFIPVDYASEFVSMAPEQQEAYDSMERDFMVWLKSTGDAVTADQVLAKHIKLQQISSGFIIDENKKPHDLMPFDKTPKFMRLLEKLEEEIPSKVIVVALHTHAMDNLEKHLEKFRPAVIRGSAYMKATGRDVEQEKLRFNTDPKCRVMLMQEAAGKYGHTLVGTDDDPCSTVVFYENSYSLDDRAQSEQRPQSINQAFGTCVIDFESTDIEQRVVCALRNKTSVAEAIVKGYKDAAKTA